MKLSLISSLALAAAMVTPALAHADTFTITTASTAAPGTTPYTITFTLPASPTAVTPIGGSYPGFEISATVTENGVTFNNDILTFYTTAGFGGLTDGDSPFGPYGSQLFTGSTSAPTFSLGSFNLSNESYGGNTDYIITIAAGSTSTTPEPSSLALLGTGVLGLAGAARRRFTR